MTVLAAAEQFLHERARLLDRRIFEARFQGIAPARVLDALRGYRNDDGGFGFALEPDLRAPTSQPIFVEIAFQAMHEAGARDDDLLGGACDWLAAIAAPDGGVPPALADAMEYPRAAHWNGDWAVTPSLNPTAGIAAYLHAFGFEHPWRTKATAWCVERMREPIGSAHTLKCAVRLADAIGDADLLTHLASQLDAAEWFQREVPVTTYTQTPLHFPRRLFDDATIDAHLDDLLARQQADGGWPVDWEPPGPAAKEEWRGRWTLDALLTLREHGRI